MNETPEIRAQLVKCQQSRTRMVWQVEQAKRHEKRGQQAICCVKMNIHSLARQFLVDRN